MALRCLERHVRTTLIARCPKSGKQKVVAYGESYGNTADGRKYVYSGWEIIAPKCGIFDRFALFRHADWMREYYIVRTYFCLD